MHLAGKAYVAITRSVWGTIMLQSLQGELGRFRTTFGSRPCHRWRPLHCSNGSQQLRLNCLHAVADVRKGSDGAAPKPKADLARLNSSQRAAADHGNGPCRVMAGPGSGKTRVLVSRVANLIDSGVPPSEIMAITFTRKAGAEMRERLNRLLGEKLSKKLIIGTYHSICGSILRRWIRYLPGAPEYTGKFTTAADQDVQQVLTTILTYKLYQAPDYKQLQPQEQISSDLYKALVRAEFERDQRLRSTGRARKRTAKISPVIAGKMLDILKKVVTGGESLWPGRQNRLKFFQDLAMKISDDVTWHDRDAYLPIWPEVMAELYEELEASNVVWIGMYIALVNELLLSQPQLLQLMEGYRHVLVDEVQDNDRSQYDFVSTICKRHQNVFFVGDLEQAIYQFRGADAELFGTEVTRTFPAIKDYGMYENYRSLNSIVRVAEAVARALESSGGHLRKSPTVMRPGDLPVVFTAAQNEQEEAERIVESVQHFLQSGVPGSEIAVIYPKHVYGDGVEARLLRQRIPYRRYGNTEILNSAVGRDLLAYLAMVANPLHRPALNRIYNKPARGIAEAGWQKLHNQLEADPRGPSMPAFLFGGLDDVWVAPEVVQALLDECFKEEEPEKLMVRLKQLMQEETQAGRLAPELDFTSVNLPKKPTVNQRQALQGLRNLVVCVWSEAARHGPERAMAVLQILSGYRDQLMASDDDGLDIADFFVVMMRDSVTDPAGGALGVHMEGAWDGAAGLEAMAPPATGDDARPDGTPPGYSAGENEDYFHSLLRPNQPLMHDYDPGKPPGEHAGMSLVRACADSMTFLESGPDRPPPGDTVSTLGSKEDQKVQLMTMHKAKGLEFRVVILLGLSQFGLTGRRKGDGGDELAAAEAQRNLLYVAVTRAKDALVLSSRRGLSFAPRSVAAERDFGAPSWLLAHLYEAFQVAVTEKDVSMPMPVMPGRSVSRLQAGKPEKVIVSNRGYPIASGWDQVEQLAQRLMQRESEP